MVGGAGCRGLGFGVGGPWGFRAAGGGGLDADVVMVEGGGSQRSITPSNPMPYITAVCLQVGTPLTHERFLRRHRGSYGPAIRAGEGLFPGVFQARVWGLGRGGSSARQGLLLPRWVLGLFRVRALRVAHLKGQLMAGSALLSSWRQQQLRRAAPCAQQTLAGFRCAVPMPPPSRKYITQATPPPARPCLTPPLCPPPPKCTTQATPPPCPACWPVGTPPSRALVCLQWRRAAPLQPTASPASATTGHCWTRWACNTIIMVRQVQAAHPCHACMAAGMQPARRCQQLN